MAKWKKNEKLERALGRASEQPDGADDGIDPIDPLHRAVADDPELIWRAVHRQKSIRVELVLGRGVHDDLDRVGPRAA